MDDENSDIKNSAEIGPGGRSGVKAFFAENFSGIAVLIAGAMIAGAVIYKDGGVLPPRQGAVQQPAADQAAGNIEVGTLPALGDPRAKVTLVEFGDYQCPFCGRFFQQVEQRLRDEYVQSGKIRFVWRDFAFLGQESVWAAIAARCANEQGKFWEYHDELFLRQAGENEGAFSKENLKRFANDLGLNAGAFDQCLESEKYRQEVEADNRAASQYGVSGTPTVFVDSQKLVGALPYEQFKSVIDSALQK